MKAIICDYCGQRVPGSGWLVRVKSRWKTRHAMGGSTSITETRDFCSQECVKAGIKKLAIPEKPKA